MLLSGDAEINIDIIAKVAITCAITATTPHIPVPEWGFSVANIKFGLFISGANEVGVEFETDAFKFALNAKGHIARGFVYDAVKNSQDYIKEQKFHFEKTGPKLSFLSTTIKVYMQPTINLHLEHVGYLTFGNKIQAAFEFERKKQIDDTTCSLYVTISPSIEPFIGVNIDTLGLKWNKTIPLFTLQPDAWIIGDCIGQAALIKAQTSLIPEFESNRGIGFQPLRRMLGSNAPQLESVPELQTHITSAFIDLHNIIDEEAIATEGWGNAGTEWWANITVIEELCDDWTTTCSNSSSAIPILLPHNSTLMIHVLNNETMIALYKTSINIDSDKWNVANTMLYTNLSCLARHKLTLETINEHDDIPTYNIELLETYCDTDLINIGIDESNNPDDYEAFECMITM
eukprot:208136_1